MMGRASDVFMRYGIKSVTMDDLARQLGISKKTIYKYFEDKDELVRTMMESKLSEDRATCESCSQDSDNAIDELFNISRFVVEHISNINPTVFYDLQKYHPDAWKLMQDHKWDFILSNFRENIQRGIAEKIYRDNINVEIIARQYVASIDTILGGDIYPWPEFKVEQVFLELLRFNIRGLANDEGIKYLKQKFNREINE